MATARMPVLLAYAGFVLVGLGAGVSGVLLPAQIHDYDVAKATIGLTFFTGSAGFVLGSASAGALLHRIGTRLALVVGGAGIVLAGLCTAIRPPLVLLIAVQVISGYGTGVLESVLNAYLARLPRATTVLNRLHAFFGLGALLGPLLATWLLRFADWTAVPAVLALAGIPVVIGMLVSYPHAEPATERAAGEPQGGRLVATLRRPVVLLAATLLSVYVGLELGVGNWGYSYLVEARGEGAAQAGYTISGYWLGLTAGRFVISPIAARLRLSDSGLMYLVMTGALTSAGLAWLTPGAAAATVGMALLGCFLGPIFPTTMAVMPGLAPASLVPTAIGVLNAGSAVGGSAMPWLAGAIAQGIGAWTLLPVAVGLAALQLLIWWRLAARLAPAQREVGT